MNYVVAGVNAGILTPNEARKYLGRAELTDADELKDTTGKPATPISGSSPQDTGGGGNVSSIGKVGQAGKA
jgi:hypothetical protein